MRVLIVDDQDFIRRGVRALLSAMLDIEVCGEASNGQEAILEAENLKPDVIIMDLSMPGMNGLQAIREIRRLHSEIQIVILSQYDIPASVAKESGAISFISKVSLWTKLVPTLRGIQFGDSEDPEDESQQTYTPLEKAHKALREMEERFRSTFEQSAVGITHVSPDGHHLRANYKLCELLGYSRHEFQSLRFHDITHPADLVAELDLSRRLMIGEIDRYSVETRFIRKDGHILPVDLTVNAVRDSRGKLKFCIRIVGESVARKSALADLEAAKRELAVATRHLDLLANHTTASANRCSRDLKYFWVNQHYANWLGKSVDQIVGQPIVDVIGREAFSVLRPHFEEVLAGKEVTCEETTTYGSREPRRISAAYRPIPGPSGSVTGWLAVVRDLTTPKSRSAPF